MSWRDLLLLYGVVGMACAVAVLRRASPRWGAASLASALLSVPLWPLWAPFALGVPPGSRGPASASRAEGDEAAPLARIERALAEAVDAVAGTPMSDVFSRGVAARIEAEVRRVASRLDELREIEVRTARDARESAQRVTDLVAQGAPE